MITANIKGNINGNNKIKATIANVANVKSNLVISAAHYEKWTGEYIFTPTREDQIIPVKNHIMEYDIIFEKIPPQYGLVTYNGSKIRIS